MKMQEKEPFGVWLEEMERCEEEAFSFWDGMAAENQQDIWFSWLQSGKEMEKGWKQSDESAEFQ